MIIYCIIILYRLSDLKKADCKSSLFLRMSAALIHASTSNRISYMKRSFCYDQIGSLSSLTFIVVKNILEDCSHSEGHQGSLIRSSQLQRAHLKSCSVDLDR